MSIKPHRSKRKKQHGRYTQQLSSWYLFAGLILLNGKYITNLEDEEYVAMIENIRIMKDYFSSSITGMSMVDGIGKPKISEKVFIKAYNYFCSLFTPLIPDRPLRPDESSFYESGPLEYMKYNLMDKSEMTEEQAESELRLKFIHSVSNPMNDLLFLDYLEQRKMEYLIYADEKSKKKLIDAYTDIFTKGPQPRETWKWPTNKIFRHQFYFTRIKEHPVSNDELENIRKLAKKRTDLFGEFIDNTNTLNNLIDETYEFKQRYYPCYYYFFKCLNALEPKKSKKILLNINIRLSLRDHLSSKVRSGKIKNLTNGKILGGKSNLILWKDIIPEKIT